MTNGKDVPYFGKIGRLLMTNEKDVPYFGKHVTLLFQLSFAAGFQDISISVDFCCDYSRSTKFGT